MICVCVCVWGGGELVVSSSEQNLNARLLEHRNRTWLKAKAGREVRSCKG